MPTSKDSTRNKILYLFIPGLIGWVAGYWFLSMNVNNWLKGLTLIIMTPVFIGLLTRIDKKAYFTDNFDHSMLLQRVVWLWNTGIILLFLSFVGGDPSQ